MDHTTPHEQLLPTNRKSPENFKSILPVKKMLKYRRGTSHPIPERHTCHLDKVQSMTATSLWDQDGCQVTVSYKVIYNQQIKNLIFK